MKKEFNLSEKTVISVPMKKAYLFILCIMIQINTQAQKLTHNDLEKLSQCTSTECVATYLQAFGYTRNMEKSKPEQNFDVYWAKKGTFRVFAYYEDFTSVYYNPPSAFILQELTREIQNKGIRVPLNSEGKTQYKVGKLTYSLGADYDANGQLSRLSMSSIDLTPLPIGASTGHLSFVDANGQVHYLSEFKGKVVYIETWASWCKYCLAALPNVKKMINQLKLNEKEDVVFLFLNAEQEQAPWLSAVRRYEYDKYGVNFQTTIQSYGKNPSVAFDCKGYPQYTLINKQGRLHNNNTYVPGPEAITEIRKLINQ